MQEYTAYTQDLARLRRSSSAGDALAADRHRDDRAVAGRRALVTDGPFAETKEQLGGYYIVDVESTGRGDRLGGEDPVGARSARSRCGR